MADLDSGFWFVEPISNKVFPPKYASCEVIAIGPSTNPKKEEKVEKEIEKPKKVEEYKPDEDLPDCIVIQKGDMKPQNSKWFYEVTCNHCQSLLITRSIEKVVEKPYSVSGITIGYSISETYRFWCPCCQKISTNELYEVRSYPPTLLRNPYLGLERRIPQKDCL
jgi:hypothetical protein